MLYCTILLYYFRHIFQVLRVAWKEGRKKKEFRFLSQFEYNLSQFFFFNINPGTRLVRDPAFIVGRISIVSLRLVE